MSARAKKPLGSTLVKAVKALPSLAKPVAPALSNQAAKKPLPREKVIAALKKLHPMD